MYIAIYANGTFLGEFAKGTDDVLGKEIGNTWFMINIPKFASGKFLTLEIIINVLFHAKLELIY